LQDVWSKLIIGKTSTMTMLLQNGQEIGEILAIEARRIGRTRNWERDNGLHELRRV
jgi:hypothetical protein